MSIIDVWVVRDGGDYFATMRMTEPWAAALEARGCDVYRFQAALPLKEIGTWVPSKREARR